MIDEEARAQTPGITRTPLCLPEPPRTARQPQVCLCDSCELRSGTGTVCALSPNKCCSLLTSLKHIQASSACHGSCDQVYTGKVFCSPLYLLGLSNQQFSLCQDRTFSA